MGPNEGILLALAIRNTGLDRIEKINHQKKKKIRRPFIFFHHRYSSTAYLIYLFFRVFIDSFDFIVNTFFFFNNRNQIDDFF